MENKCTQCKFNKGNICENTNWKTGKQIDHSVESVCGNLSYRSIFAGWAGKKAPVKAK